MSGMATSFEHTQEFAGDPATVMAMMRDPDYIRLKCERTGSLSTTVDVQDGSDGGVVLTSTRVLPAKVPSAAKAFVGETLTVTEVQTWGPLADDGTATATGSVDFGAPLAFEATITLASSGASTTIRTTGSFKASVPFVGGQIERGAAEQTEKYLTIEEQVGNEWLSR
jgi:hypothetical protein